LNKTNQHIKVNQRFKCLVASLCIIVLLNSSAANAQIKSSNTDKSKSSKTATTTSKSSSKKKEITALSSSKKLEITQVSSSKASTKSNKDVTDKKVTASNKSSALKTDTKKINEAVAKKTASATDTLFKYKKEAPRNNAESANAEPKLGYAESKIKPKVPSTENSKIAKKKPTFGGGSTKSAQDPNALNFSGFKVSKELYGDYATIIYDYVKNYHGNFGNYLGRIKSNNKSNMAMIDNAMRKAGLPKEFRSLAVIESGLNPNAVSPVGAVGPWQFMEPTAEMLGLRVDETIDERRDFQKSTIAAGKYCKRLHNMFHDWLLVVASYNCGPSPIIRHLQRTGGSSFWDIKQYLPKETQNHVMAFIATSVYYDKNTKVLDLGGTPKAAALAFAKTKAAELKNKEVAKANTKPKAKTTKVAAKADDESDLAIAEEEEVRPFDPNAPLFLEGETSQVVTLKVKGAYNLETISEFLDYEISKLRRWNPNFNKLAGENTALVKLVLPMSGLDAFLIQKEKILQQSVKNPKSNTNNETVAAKYKVPTVVKVKKEEATDKPKDIAKTDIKIQATSKSDVKQNSTSENTKIVAEKNVVKTNGKRKYVIKQGDQLTKIAETFGITVERLRELNQGESSALKPGHTLYLE
jgi:membrane-bound lytic murein transglycosylase D